MKQGRRRTKPLKTVAFESLELKPITPTDALVCVLKWWLAFAVFMSLFGQLVIVALEKGWL